MYRNLLSLSLSSLIAFSSMAFSTSAQASDQDFDSDERRIVSNNNTQIDATNKKKYSFGSNATCFFFDLLSHYWGKESLLNASATNKFFRDRLITPQCFNAANLFITLREVNYNISEPFLSIFGRDVTDEEMIKMLEEKRIPFRLKFNGDKDVETEWRPSDLLMLVNEYATILDITDLSHCMNLEFELNGVKKDIYYVFNGEKVELAEYLDKYKVGNLKDLREKLEADDSLSVKDNLLYASMLFKGQGGMRSMDKADNIISLIRDDEKCPPRYRVYAKYLNFCRRSYYSRLYEFSKNDVDELVDNEDLSCREWGEVVDRLSDSLRILDQQKFRDLMKKVYVQYASRITIPHLSFNILRGISERYLECYDIEDDAEDKSVFINFYRAIKDKPKAFFYHFRMNSVPMICMIASRLYDMGEDEETRTLARDAYEKIINDGIVYEEVVDKGKVNEKVFEATFFALKIGKVLATYRLAEMQYLGQGGGIDYLSARENYTRVVNCGGDFFSPDYLPMSHYALAIINYYGLCGEVNYFSARENFTRVINNRFRARPEVWSMTNYMLAMMNYYGEGGAKDFAHAHQVFMFLMNDDNLSPEYREQAKNFAEAIGAELLKVLDALDSQ